MPSDDLEPRVAGLEAQVHKLGDQVRAVNQDAAAARILAGAADRDVNEFRGELLGLRGELRDFRRATAASFNALRADMTDGFGEAASRFGEVADRFSQVDNGFIEMRGKFDATATGQQRIVELLEGLIAGQG